MKRITLTIAIIVLLCGTTDLYSDESLIFVIRADDIMSRNETILPRSIEPFEKVVEERGGVITWAVIPHRLIEPANEDGLLNAELRRSAAAGHEINLHGFNHICARCGQSSHEMYCTRDNVSFNYDHQEKLIRNGLKIIADSVGAEIISFVPPGHHADNTTYEVLLDNGIPWISTTGSVGYIYNDLFNLPPHNEFTWTLFPDTYNERLEAALQDIQFRGESDGYYCLLLHDPFIRLGYNEGIVIDWMAELLDSLNSRYEDRIRYKTLSDAARIVENRITTVHREEPPIAGSIYLYQNYPNPFNPSTTIRFDIPERMHVSVEIYSSIGQKLAVLVSGELEAGEYTTQWIPENLGSGIYFYRIRAGNQVMNRSMLYVK